MSCMGCLVSTGIAGLVVLVLLLLLSRFAFSAFRALLVAGFELAKVAALATVALINTLSPIVLLALIGSIVVTLGWLIRTQRQRYRWRMLDSIRREWVPLQKLLCDRKMTTYQKQLDAVQQRLFAERDRIEAIDNLCAHELPLLQKRLKELSKMERAATSRAEKAELQKMMKDLGANSSHLADKGLLQAQFEALKVRLAVKLQSLRLRLSDVSHDASAMQSILDGVDSVSYLHELFDAKTPTGSSETFAAAANAAANAAAVAGGMGSAVDAVDAVDAVGDSDNHGQFFDLFAAEDNSSSADDRDGHDDSPNKPGTRPRPEAKISLPGDKKT